MPLFAYRARDLQGNLVEGSVEESDRNAAMRELERKRFVPISIRENAAAAKIPAAGAAAPIAMAPKASPKAAATADKATAAASGPNASLRLSHSLRLIFTEQLANLLSAGMTLDEALAILQRRLKQPTLQQATARMHQLLVDGRSFSQALAEFPKSFPPLYVNLVQAGEASGALPEILRRLVKHLQEVKALRDRVQQALLYPGLLSIFGVLLVILFITVLVPQLTGFFSKTGGTLPLPTRMLIGVNDVIVRYWWVGVGTILGGYALFRTLTKSPAGQEAWDRFRLRIPGYGRVVKYRFYAQFARTLSTLMHNGVTLLRSVDLVANIAENAHLSRLIRRGRNELVEGASLSKAMGQQDLFPELLVDMMAVGEQTGRFAETMTMIADIYERELDKQVKFATELIPPLIIVVIALLVGAVVFAIMSAVFSIASGLKGRAGGG